MSRSKTKKKSVTRKAASSKIKAKAKAKSTNVKSTASTKSVNTSDLQQLEKYIMQAPSAMAAQLAKQISAVKKKKKN